MPKTWPKHLAPGLKVPPLVNFGLVKQSAVELNKGLRPEVPPNFLARTSNKLAQVLLRAPQIGQVAKQVPGGGVPGSSEHLMAGLVINRPIFFPPETALADSAQAAITVTKAKLSRASQKLTFFLKTISQ